MRQIVILGGGGHASDVLSLIESLGMSSANSPAVIVDEGKPDMGRFAARDVVMAKSLQAVAELAGHDAPFVSGVGYPIPRAHLVESAMNHGLVAAAPLVHETAVINANVSMQPGAVVMGHTWLSPAIEIHSHVYVGYGAKLGHDCVIGDYTSLLPGCFIGGNAVIGARCLIGANATVLPGVSVGEGSQVGAGAVVTQDVLPGITVVGVPASETPSTTR